MKWIDFGEWDSDNKWKEHREMLLSLYMQKGVMAKEGSSRIAIVDGDGKIIEDGK